MTSTPDLGAALAAARLAAAKGRKPLSFDKLERAIFSQLGEYAPSNEKLRVWHTPGGLDPWKADLLVLGALGAVYDIDPATLHPVIAERIEGARVILFRTRTPKDAAKEGAPTQFRWTERTARLASAVA